MVGARHRWHLHRGGGPRRLPWGGPRHDRLAAPEL